MLGFDVELKLFSVFVGNINTTLFYNMCIYNHIFSRIFDFCFTCFVCILIFLIFYNSKNILRIPDQKTTMFYLYCEIIVDAEPSTTCKRTKLIFSIPLNQSRLYIINLQIIQKNLSIFPCIDNKFRKSIFNLLHFLIKLSFSLICIKTINLLFKYRAA